MKMLGILLIVLGMVAFTFQGVVWITTREQVAKIGPIEIQRERERPVPLAPILGGVAIGAGALLLASSSRKTAG